MNTERACQILQAEETIDVFYNGNPVWIQSVNVDAASASIQDNANTEQVLIVPVSELQEK